jgi:hypothetical protein
MRTYNQLVYTIDAVTVKSYTLTEILQSLLQPAAMTSNDAEVTDVIKTDLINITIIESITNRAPDYTDAVTITITDNIQKDPLGAGVAPSWVLGPYFPSSITDTKRVGILNNSLKVY